MRWNVGSWVVLVGLLTTPLALGQRLPPPLKPTRPDTKEERDRLEAQKLFAQGLLHEAELEWVSALRLFEKARQLDPNVAAIHKALVPIYTSLDRTEDALKSAARALELNPTDFRTALHHARQLRLLDRNKEALAVLRRTTANNELGRDAEMFLLLWGESAIVCEELELWADAAVAHLRVVEILTQPERLEQSGKLDKDELRDRTAEAYEQAGSMFLEAGQHDKALDAWQNAVKVDRDRIARLDRHRAELFFGQKDYANAKTAIESYLKTEPEDVEAQELRVKILLAGGRSREILAALQQAAGLNPDNVSLKLLVAKEHRRLGQVGTASAVYSRLMRSHPSPDVLRGWLDMQKAVGARVGDEVLSLLIQADTDDEKKRDPIAAARARALLLVIRDDPSVVGQTLQSAKRRLVTGSDLPFYVRSWLADLAERTNRLDEAEELYKSCLALGVRRRVEHSVYSGLLNVLGRRHKYKDVVAICRKGLEDAQRTNRVLFHLTMSRAQMQLGQVEASLKSADNAVGESNERSMLSARTNKCRLLGQAGRHRQAIRECRALLKDYNKLEDVRDVRYALSGVYTLAKDYPRAEAQLQRILDEDANDATACNDLGYLWADQNKNLGEAETLIRKAMRLDERERTSGTDVRIDSDLANAAYEDSLGWVLFRRGKLDEAKKHLERAANSADGKDDPVLWDHLGDVCFRLKQPARAAQCWKKSLTLFELGQRRFDVGRRKAIEEKLKYVPKP